jgi:hypothetical protein
MDRERKAKKPATWEISIACPGTQVVCLFLVAILQWATVLAVCPSLHELIHPDADDEHHECGATLFLAGQVEQPAVEPTVIIGPARILVFVDETCDAQSTGSSFLSCRMMEHAPPRLA